MKALFIIWMLLRRIVNQWRLELCLFFGLLAAMAVAVAVPLYTGGVLQDSFLAEMKSTNSDSPPFTYRITITSSQWSSETALTKKRLLNDFAFVQNLPIPARMGIPAIYSGWSSMLTDYLNFSSSKNTIVNYNTPTAKIFTITGLEQLVTFEEGRAPNAAIGPDGTVEMVCSVTAADQLGLVVGNTYRMKNTLLKEEKPSYGSGEPELKIELGFRLVGTFNIRTDRLNSPAWLISPDFTSSVFVNPVAFIDYLVGEKGVTFADIDLTWIMDSRRTRVQDLPRLLTVFADLEKEMAKYDRIIAVTDSPKIFFDDFNKKQTALQLMMLTLALPTLLLIIYFILLMAGLIVDQRRGEIAMLRSRGAGVFQLTGMFFLEWSILGLGCLLAGPPLGVLMAQLVGSSIGFLNFVDRKALPIVLTNETYLYSTILAVIIIAAATVPAALACRNSIIKHKQTRSRGSSKPIWHRFYLDFLLLGVGIYGYRLMTIQAQAADESSAALEKLIDPLLFLTPTILALAAGLLVIRVLPAITGLIEKLISRRKGVALYASLVEVSRNIAGFKPLILLIILTTAGGIYGAALARTLDQNTRDRIYYSAGADVVLSEQWYRLIFDRTAGGLVPDKERPFEPPFSVHRKLPGVDKAARVQINKGVNIGFYNEQRTVDAMAVDPYDFGHTAWFRQGLTPLHQNIYLNFLTQYPEAAIVSKSLLENTGLKTGDTITLYVNKAKVPLVIAGVVDYWPTLYEDERPFLITNLNYVTDQSSINFYYIWLRMKPGAKVAPVLKTLLKQDIYAKLEVNARHELADARKEPQRMGLYGIMSIGFIITVLITVIGYILYTFISLKKRLLQFGVMRAIGLSFRQLVCILVYEQLCTAGVGLLMGMIIGQTISWIFVPFLRTATAISGKIPPFEVTISGGDIAVIYSILLPVLVLALAGLAFSLARLQVHQAVKLGEDS